MNNNYKIKITRTLSTEGKSKLEQIAKINQLDESACLDIIIKKIKNLRLF